MLVVDGRETSTNAAAISPLTYLVALLEESLESLPGTVSMDFFCSFYAKLGDGLEGA